jgi:hypothetical protein
MTELRHQHGKSGMLTSFRSGREHDILQASSAHRRHGVGPMKRISLAAVVALAAATISQAAASQSAEPRLGKVHFATSCSPQAQALFDRAMLYQHSFW